MISVRKHLTRTLLGTALALGGAGAAVMFLAARAAAVNQFDAALQARALAVSTLTSPAPGGVTVTFTDHFMRGFDDHDPRDFFEIWDPSGRPLARSESLSGGDLPRPGRFGGQAVFSRVVLPDGKPGRSMAFSFRPKAPGTRIIGPPVDLLVASDASGLDEDLWRLVAIAGASGVILLGATFWLIPRALRQGLQPLEQLGDRAVAIDSRSLDTRFAVAELPDELRPIASRLNDLLGRIEASFERERRFSADLAHELRTPLAELRNLVECSIKWPETRGAGEDREILAISAQMEKIVSHLLASARDAEGQAPVRLETLDLGQVVRERWARFSDRASARGLAADLRLADAPVSADPVLLRSIVDNLLENAVEYSSAPAVLQLRVEPAAGRHAFRIENPAEDLTAADVPLLFERFWRKDAARATGQHAGLGLSLSRAFAEAMGWALTASLGPAGLLAMTLAPGPKAAALPPS